MGRNSSASPFRRAKRRLSNETAYACRKKVTKCEHALQELQRVVVKNSPADSVQLQPHAGQQGLVPIRASRLFAFEEASSAKHDCFHGAVRMMQSDRSSGEHGLGDGTVEVDTAQLIDADLESVSVRIELCPKSLSRPLHSERPSISMRARSESPADSISTKSTAQAKCAIKAASASKYCSCDKPVTARSTSHSLEQVVGAPPSITARGRDAPLQ